VIFLTPLVLRYAAIAQGQVVPLPADDPSRTDTRNRTLPASASCGDFLEAIENQVFRLEQAMQLAEVAADQAIARAAASAHY